jgi:hypothetical protein
MHHVAVYIRDKIQELEIIEIGKKRLILGKEGL